MKGEYKGWRYRMAVVEHQDHVQEYSIQFYRPHRDDWYDEIRYDSHERKGGEKRQRPHLHVKLQSAFKRPSIALNEIKVIIDTHLGALKEVVEQ